MEVKELGIFKDYGEYFISILLIIYGCLISYLEYFHETE